MIIFWGRMVFAPNDFEKAKQAALAVMIESRKEEGCLDYCFCEGIDLEYSLHFYEEFHDEVAADVHKTTDHYVDFKSVLAELEMTFRDVKKHVVEM